MKPLKDYACFFVKNKLIMFVVISIIIGGSNFSIAQNEDLSVVKHWMKYSDASNSLYHHLSSQILQHLNKRSLEIEKITTKKG